MLRHLGRLLALLLLALIALQLYFVARIALMSLFDPQSTSFQRSEAWRLLSETGRISWSQQWVPDARISPQLKRAVIASEDSTFVDHAGVDWESMEKAWERNQRAEAQAARRAPSPRPIKIVGGSTITQQLAKNLFLSGERTPLRKGQELVLTYLLEAFLSKQRILEIYLNNVEWGEGLFGAQAAARHYFRTDAVQLGAWPAARLAVMLPAPKRYEKRMNSGYLSERAGVVVARMSAVELP
jgi:monofunctional biosynthetic peptidoglycan transglycosylase